MTESTPPKPALRRAALARRDALLESDRTARSEAIASHALEQLDRFHYRCLAGFLPIRSEVDPTTVMAVARAKGRQTALPGFEADGSMVFRAFDEATPLVPAGFGTQSPGPEATIVVPEAILVPLAAFDRNGSRIGYGKGHYDRAIAAFRAGGHRPLLIGLAFTVQEVPSIPAEPHDIGLHMLVTESEVLDFRKG